MAECEVCGAASHLSHACRYCDGDYCTEHHLPENHDCIAIGAAQTLGPEFRNAGSGEITIGDEEAAGVTSTTYSTASDEKETHECPDCGKEIEASRPLCASCRIESNSTAEPDDSRTKSAAQDTSAGSRSYTNEEQCELCGELMGDFGYECNYCDGVFCTKHRLPERHDCIALDNPELFKKHDPAQDSASSTTKSISEIDLQSERHYSEVDVEPMELSSDQTVGSTSKSPISDSSPDVAPDGSLVYEDDDDEADEDADSGEDDGYSKAVIAGAIVLTIAIYLVLFVVV